MAEHVLRPQDPRLDPRLDVSHQYGTSANVRARFALYDYAADGRNVHQEIISDVKPVPNEVIVDVGCADGKTLSAIANQFPIPLTLLGLDIDALLLAPYQNRPSSNDNISRPSFLAGSANELPLKDRSADTVLALFVLYHVPQPEDALAEFQRILKPDGRLAVATSGPDNKPRHRQFEQSIAHTLGIEPPPVFAEPFNSVIAETMLPEFFDVESHNTQRTYAKIGEDAIFSYILSLNTMRDAFEPRPNLRDWLQVIEDSVTPVIHSEVAKNGYFAEPIDRSYFWCRQSSD